MQVNIDVSAGVMVKQRAAGTGLPVDRRFKGGEIIEGSSVVIRL
jgi:hypothetical protein